MQQIALITNDRLEGVRVRHGGRAYGVIAVVGKWALETHEGFILDARECTILKTTVTAIWEATRSYLEDEDTHLAHLAHFDHLSLITLTEDLLLTPYSTQNA